jgi:hypothetical protein
MKLSNLGLFNSSTVAFSRIANLNWSAAEFSIPEAELLPAAPDSELPVTGLTELCVLSRLPEGVTEILSMNCTEPEEEVVVFVTDTLCFEAPGLTVLQLASRKRTAIKRVVFNILSTSEDIGTDKYSK